MKTSNFDSKLNVNNYVCRILRDRGLPTNKGNKLEVLEEIANHYKECENFKAVLTAHK